MNDTIVTAKAKVQLTFDDNTTVKVTEQSKLVIDDFVYDPKKGSGKIAMKVVLGTARYASGQIARTNPQAVDIKTPTATVAVRGTDFSMTVDELGRSLVVLLPSCDSSSCVTGVIEVITDAGSVVMDVAYQATLVTSSNVLPSKPVILVIDQMNINNMLVVVPPIQITTESQEKSNTKTALDVNFLDKDLLKYNKLDEDELKAFKELDINYLDFDLLPNALDQANAALAASQEQLSQEKSMLPNLAPGLIYGISEDGKLVLLKGGAHITQVTVDQEANIMLNVTQDGSHIYQKVNSGGTTTINIIQK